MIANIRQAMTVPVRRSCYAKMLKLRSDSGDSGVKNCNGGAYGEVWRSMRLSGVWSQAVGFLLVCFVALWRQSPREDFFTFNLLYKDIL
jgi:hypothetical protein